VSLSVYVCGPYSSGPDLRARLLPRLAAIGVECTSTWWDHAGGSEDFAKFSVDELRNRAELNDSDLRAADVVLLVDPGGRGRETYSELARALEWGKPVIWAGKPTLSAWRAGVYQALDLEDALEVLEMVARGDIGLDAFPADVLPDASLLQESK
jgi:hypothetical protein